MNKLFTYATIALFAIACNKKNTDPPPNAGSLQVQFKLDGKQYSKVLEADQLTGTGSFSFPIGSTGLTSATGPIYQLDNGMELTIEFGFLHTIVNDAQGNYERTRQLLSPGDKEYKCLVCDTSIVSGVSVDLWEKNVDISWYSTKTDSIDFQPIPLTDEQNGSSFIITDVKDTTVNSGADKALIVKGTFSCNLFKKGTNDKRVLTDGQFSCVMNAF